MPPLLKSVSTFSAAVDMYFSLRSRFWTSDQTRKLFLRMGEAWKEVLGTKPFREIEPLDVQAIYASRDNGERSPAYLNRERDALHGVFSWARKLRLCEENSVNGASWPRFEKSQKGPRSRSQVRIDRGLLAQIIRAAPDRYRRLFFVLYPTGLRIGEALGARWSWVVPDARDPRTWVLQVPGEDRHGFKRKQRRGYAVPLGGRVLQILGPRGGEGDPLFPEAPSASGVRQALHRIGIKLGLRGLSPHQFRRACTTQLLQRMSPKSVQNYIGGTGATPEDFLEMVNEHYDMGAENDQARRIQDDLLPE